MLFLKGMLKGVTYIGSTPNTSSYSFTVHITSKFKLFYSFVNWDCRITNNIFCVQVDFSHLLTQLVLSSGEWM